MAPFFKILLVVDQPHELRDELGEFLRARGFIAVPVPDPDSATVVVDRLRPDVVVWNAPPPGAVSAIAEWKQRRPGLAVVAVTGDAALRQVGADAVLPAPIVFSHLHSVIARLLRMEDRDQMDDRDVPGA